MNIRPTTAVAAAAILRISPAASAAGTVVFRGDLVDLSSTTADPFGDASAHLVFTETGKGTRFHLRVKGIDLAAVGNVYGAHLHVGACVPGNAAAASGHYKASTATPPVVNDQTEVWLDFEVTGDGTGAADTLMPFVPVPGGRFVVIHAQATVPSGAAGSRLVCLPVVW